MGPGLDGQLSSSAFLAACRRERPAHTPVWFMRQAGRSLPEYRKLREGVPMLESCTRPDMVVEVTMQPVRRHVETHLAEGLPPRRRVHVDRVHEGAVEIEHGNLESGHECEALPPLRPAFFF